MALRRVKASLNKKSIHGEYVGISSIAVRDGKGIEESKIRLFVSDEGIDIGSLAHDGNRCDNPFMVHYSPDWIFHLKNWGVDHCLSLRQAIKSDLAQLIFDFTPFSMIKPVVETGKISRIVEFAKSFKKRVKLDVCMYMGEGIPAILGVFMHKHKRKNVDAEMERLYGFMRESLYVAGEENDQSMRSWLLGIDMNDARLTMISPGLAEEKIQVLEKASHNLWTGTEKEIGERIEIIRLGINSDIPEVQIKALNTFVLGGRVRHGIGLLEDFFKKNNLQNAKVLAKAIEATTCLLYEAFSRNKHYAAMMKSFGTTDVAEIHRLSRGILSPEQYNAFNHYQQRRPSSSWTLDDQKALRSILESVPEKENILGSRLIAKCFKSLDEYPML